MLSRCALWPVDLCCAAPAGPPGLVGSAEPGLCRPPGPRSLYPPHISCSALSPPTQAREKADLRLSLGEARVEDGAQEAPGQAAGGGPGRLYQSPFLVLLCFVLNAII